MDNEAQKDENLSYTIEDLNKDLQIDNGIVSLNASIETNEFSSVYENHVSQSDFGLRIIINNNFEKDKNRDMSYLIQAKKMMPNSKTLVYNEGSVFKSIDKEQEVRIKILQSAVGDSIKYMLYCPRPEKLDEKVCAALKYLRITALENDIFDFLQGQEVYRNAFTNDSFIGAGIFLCDVNQSGINLGKIHRHVLKDFFPLGWFIASHFINHQSVSVQHGLSRLPRMATDVSIEQQRITKGIITGDEEIIGNVIKNVFKDVETASNFTFFPKQTLTLTYSIGVEGNLSLKGYDL
jgi:hypothetical protein